MASKYKSIERKSQQQPQWNQFLVCSVCEKEFNRTNRCPISLGCGHTVCRCCLADLKQPHCQMDQTGITCNVSDLPVNSAILLLMPEDDVHMEAVETTPPRREYRNDADAENIAQYLKLYESAKRNVEQLALYLRPNKGPELTRPMQRKLVALINCQLVEGEGRKRALRAGRALGERCATELILLHQNPTTLSASLWAAVRARGCQFLGPAMQEEALKLIHFAFEDGSDSSELSRKVLVQLVVKNLKTQFQQASKTSIGHVVQLLYRASCFKVTKREGNSSLMRLKDEYLSYEELRREHDQQVVQIAREAGLRIAPDQWSALLYGDQSHKPYMQSIIDRLQSWASYDQCIQDLKLALQRSADPGNLQPLIAHFNYLAQIDAENPSTDWVTLDKSMNSVRVVVQGLVNFTRNHNSWVWQSQDPNVQSNKYKTSMCRDSKSTGVCPRGSSCTFAHSEDELQFHRSRRKKTIQPDILAFEADDETLHPGSSGSSCMHNCHCSTDQPKYTPPQPPTHYCTAPTMEPPPNPNQPPQMHLRQPQVTHSVVQIPQHMQQGIPPQPIQMHYVTSDQVMYDPKPQHPPRAMQGNHQIYQQNVHSMRSGMLQDHPPPPNHPQNTLPVLHPPQYIIQRPHAPSYPIQPVVQDPDHPHSVPVPPQYPYQPMPASHHPEPPQLMVQPQIHLQQIQATPQVYVPPNMLMHIQTPQPILPPKPPPQEDNYTHRPAPTHQPTPCKDIETKTLDELRKRKYEVINKLVQKRITDPKLQQHKFGTIPCPEMTKTSENEQKNIFTTDTGAAKVSSKVEQNLVQISPSISQMSVVVSSGQYSLWAGTTCIPSLLSFPVQRVSSPTMVDVTSDISSTTSHVSAIRYSEEEYYIAKPDEDEVLPIQDQRIVSKYGPIARNVRSKTTSAIPEQVTANANGNMRPHASDTDLNKSNYSVNGGRPATPSVCTEVEPTSSVDHPSNRRLPDLVAHNQQSEVAGTEMQDEEEDLLLAIELQQIEMGIQRELQNHKLANDN